MKIDKINNLLELFFEKYKKQNDNDVFLHSLDKNKRIYSWGDVYNNTIKLSGEISKYINKGDRCLLISENRPEWMIADLSIMLSYGITVPAYTTYTGRDFEYIINDCSPTLIFVSNKVGATPEINACFAERLKLRTNLLLSEKSLNQFTIKSTLPHIIKSLRFVI